MVSIKLWWLIVYDHFVGIMQGVGSPDVTMTDDEVLLKSISEVESSSQKPIDVDALTSSNESEKIARVEYNDSDDFMSDQFTKRKRSINKRELRKEKKRTKKRLVKRKHRRNESDSGSHDDNDGEHKNDSYKLYGSHYCSDGEAPTQAVVRRSGSYFVDDICEESHTACRGDSSGDSGSSDGGSGDKGGIGDSGADNTDNKQTSGGSEAQEDNSVGLHLGEEKNDDTTTTSSVLGKSSTIVGDANVFCRRMGRGFSGRLCTESL
jgi:hypothetical protein